MKATKAQIEQAKSLMDEARKLLDLNDVVWQEEWKGKMNPFIAINWYLSDEQRNRRAPFIASWLLAKSKYDAIKPKKKDEELA